MPDYLERRLRAQAEKEGIKDIDHYVYGAMNNRGLMHGNKETAKGKAVERKHAADQAKGKAAKGKAAGQHPHKNLGPYLHPPKRKGGRKPAPGGY